MYIYNGKYSWSGKKETSQTPISWWPGSYNLSILDLSDITKGVHLLKPVICIFSNSGEGTATGNCTQKFIRRICEEFDLEINKVLWIEHFPNYHDLLEVLSFKKISNMAGEPMYSVQKRPVMGNELKLLQKHFPHLKHIKYELKEH